MQLEWITTQPTPYNEFLFGALAKSGLRLNVRFMAPAIASHPWRSSMRIGFDSCNSKKYCGVDLALLRLLCRRDVLFVVGGWSCITRFLLLTSAAALQRPFVIWTDTPNVLKRRNPVKAALRSAWVKWVFKNAAFVMGTGQPALNALTQMGCAERKLVNLPYFIDTDYFRPAGNRQSTREVVLVSSGRLLNSLKGCDLALTALAMIREVHPKLYSLIRYRIAGEGPDRAALEALCITLHVADRVEFVGWLEPSDLASFYASGDVLIHSALWDPYANAVTEAMSSGLAVLGSDATGAVLDRIVHGLNGLIHRAGDVTQLAEQLALIVSRRDVRMSIGTHARETALLWTVDVGVSIVNEVVVKVTTEQGA